MCVKSTSLQQLTGRSSFKRFASEDTWTVTRPAVIKCLKSVQVVAALLQKIQCRTTDIRKNNIQFAYFTKTKTHKKKKIQSTNSSSTLKRPECSLKIGFHVNLHKNNDSFSSRCMFFKVSPKRNPTFWLMFGWKSPVNKRSDVRSVKNKKKKIKKSITDAISTYTT